LLTRNRHRAASAALVAAVIAGCSAAQPPTTATGPSLSVSAAASRPAAAASSTAARRSSPADPLNLQAPRLVARMSLSEQVGSLLLPQVYGSSATPVTPAQAVANEQLLGVDTPAQAVARWHLAGFTLIEQNTTDPQFGALATGNVLDPAQLTAFTSGLQAAARASGAGAPLLLATDQEGGTVERLTAGATWMPSQQAFGAAGSPELTRQGEAVTGTELAAVGVNVALAPVADVTARPGNTVIGTRSFGADPAAVSRQVTAAVGGLQMAGVAATVKHFPGHGNTDVDSPRRLSPPSTCLRSGQRSRAASTWSWSGTCRSRRSTGPTRRACRRRSSPACCAAGSGTGEWSSPTHSAWGLCATGTAPGNQRYLRSLPATICSVCRRTLSRPMKRSSRR
jgi:beta-N-acetylhexosaminidase